jgi:Fe-Mn family superoxide dismutase
MVEVKRNQTNQQKIMMTRRQALKTTALASVALTTLPGAIAQTNSTAPAAAPSGPFTLPPLPYAYDALEPFIDEETMHIHHDKHHAAYVANLNKALAEWPDFQTKSFDFSLEMFLKNLNSVPENIRIAIRNNGGGHYNHSLFWQMMKKNGGGEPSGELAKAIDTSFGSFSTFQEKFSKAALGQFGSGWAWLVWDERQLKIEPTPNQDSPISQPAHNQNGWIVFHQDGVLDVQIPLLGLDVWEHAYYLKYQNKRADYIAAWWNVVNWDFISERYEKMKA